MTRQSPRLSNLPGFAIPAILFLVTVIAYLVFYHDFILSTFLIEDDNRHLARGIFHQVETVSDSPGKFYVIMLGSLTGSIAFVKSLTLVFFGLIAAFIYLVLKPLIDSRLLRAGVALFITTFPVAVDQPYFLTGAHPTMGVAMVMGALAWVTLSLHSGRRINAALVGAVIISVVAFRFSPTMFLMPIAPALWAAAAVLVGKLGRKYLIFYCLPVILLGVLLAWLGYQTAHYTSNSNWSSALEASVFTNLIKAVTQPFLRLKSQFGAAFVVYSALAFVMVGLSALSAIRVGRAFIARKGPLTEPDRMRLFVFLACAIAGGLAFGPSALAANFLDRYSVTVVFFTSLGLAAFASMSLPRTPPRVLMGIAGLLLVAFAWNMSIRSDAAYLKHGRALATHQQMSQIAHRDAALWPRNAQIVFLLGTGEGTTTGGLNHWSTWYVRALAGREDLLGLVGFDKWATEDPFVDAYRDHGDEYWNANHSRRLKMVGLERDRPTFVYYIKRGDALPEAIPVAFPAGDHLVVMAPGETRASVGDAHPTGPVPATAFLWRPAQKGFVSRAGCAGEFPAARIPKDVRTYSTAGGERHDMRAGIPEGACFSLEIVGRPAAPVTGPTANTVNTPPMPMLGNALAVSQKDAYYSVILRDTGEEVRLAHDGDDQTFRIVIYGKAGRWAEMYAGGYSYPLPVSILGDGLLLGKGFRERSWAGALTLALAVDGDWKPGMLDVTEKRDISLK
jgi:hypothetical protein